MKRTTVDRLIATLVMCTALVGCVPELGPPDASPVVTIPVSLSLRDDDDDRVEVAITAIDATNEAYAAANVQFQLTDVKYDIDYPTVYRSGDQFKFGAYADDGIVEIFLIDSIVCDDAELYCGGVGTTVKHFKQPTECVRYVAFDRFVSDVDVVGRIAPHEFGHIGGLMHSDDDDNTMYPNPGFELDDEQLETLERSYRDFTRCR